MLHTKEKGPEKAVRAIEPDFFLDNFKINTLPTLLIAKYFSKLLLGSKAPIFAVVSAKVGSIQDNRLGGWYSYRASKAALNMAIKTISLEWQYKVPNCCVAALHPGTTDTGLSKPFQGNVPTKKLFNTDQTATLLLNVIGKLNSKNSGRFWDWNGEELPW
jgi:NAD(P)-dependent dehydrogenase (short-subunit alcohol dehydrogenase family)